VLRILVVRPSRRGAPANSTAPVPAARWGCSTARCVCARRSGRARGAMRVRAARSSRSRRGARAR